MKITKANVAEYAEKHGLESVQIDGIPEGFSFKEPNVTINGKEHIGQYVSFAPLRDWGFNQSMIRTNTIEELVTLYTKYA